MSSTEKPENAFVSLNIVLPPLISIESARAPKDFEPRVAFTPRGASENIGLCTRTIWLRPWSVHGVHAVYEGGTLRYVERESEPDFNRQQAEPQLIAVTEQTLLLRHEP